MKKVNVIAAGCVLGAIAAVCAYAADLDVGAAALDTSKIAEMLAVADGAAKVPFLKQVIEASAKLPVDPEERPSKLADAISAGLDAIPAEQMPEALSSMVCKVPFSLLPATVDAMVPGMRARTAPMSAEDFQAALDKAVSAVQDQGLDADDANIYTAFIISLFSKLPTEGDNKPIIDAALAKVPEASRESIGSMVAAILAGDLAAVFGPEGAEEVIRAMSSEADEIERAAAGALVGDTLALDAAKFVDVGLERPVIIDKAGKKRGEDGFGYYGTTGYFLSRGKKPPVPDPYAGQTLKKKKRAYHDTYGDLGKKRGRK